MDGGPRRIRTDTSPARAVPLVAALSTTDCSAASVHWNNGGLVAVQRIHVSRIFRAGSPLKKIS